eukprot:TRINITY_DN597_c0_g1_i2.p2 TRINITY_DN597_c0_g1~~TRINITY_DN597_c0_g1_i2.p2  ORF type:complete len:223 (-),score=-10.81 TRINITY_DN597_c0_g1_i2:413-1081(-)
MFGGDLHLNLFITRIIASLTTTLILTSDTHPYKFHVNMRRVVQFTFLFVIVSFFIFIPTPQKCIALTAAWTTVECGLGLMNLAEAHMLNTILLNQSYHVGKLFYTMIVFRIVTIITHNFFKLAYFVNSIISVYTLYLIYQINKQNIGGDVYKFTVGINILQRLEIIVLVLNLSVIYYYQLYFNELYSIKGGLFVLYHFKVCVLYVLTWGYSQVEILAIEREI